RESRRWIERNLKPNIEVTHSCDLVFSLRMPRADKHDPAILGIVTRDRRGEPDDVREILSLCEKAKAHGYRIRHLVLGVGATGAADFERAKDLDIEGKEIIYTESLT